MWLICKADLVFCSIFIHLQADPAHISLCKEITAELMRGARLRIDCTADLLLVFVWDETASGTVWSKTDNINFIPFPTLLFPVPEAVLSHTKKKQGESVPHGPSFARNGCPDVQDYLVAPNIELICLIFIFFDEIVAIAFAWSQPYQQG